VIEIFEAQRSQRKTTQQAGESHQSQTTRRMRHKTIYAPAAMALSALNQRSANSISRRVRLRVRDGLG